MPRVPEKKLRLARKLLLSTRLGTTEIARRAKVSGATVVKLKKEMGLPVKANMPHSKRHGLTPEQNSALERELLEYGALTHGLAPHIAAKIGAPVLAISSRLQRSRKYRTTELMGIRRARFLAGLKKLLVDDRPDTPEGVEDGLARLTERHEVEWGTAVKYARAAQEILDGVPFHANTLDRNKAVRLNKDLGYLRRPEEITRIQYEASGRARAMPPKNLLSDAEKWAIIESHDRILRQVARHLSSSPAHAEELHAIAREHLFSALDHFEFRGKSPSERQNQTAGFIRTVARNRLLQALEEESKRRKREQPYRE